MPDRLAPRAPPGRRAVAARRAPPRRAVPEEAPAPEPDPTASAAAAPEGGLAPLPAPRLHEPVWLVRIVLVLFLVGFAAFLAREVAGFVASLP